MTPIGEGTSALEPINRSRASYQQTTVVCANNDEDDNKRSRLRVIAPGSGNGREGGPAASSRHAASPSLLPSDVPELLRRGRTGGLLMFGAAVDGLLHHALHLADVRPQTGAVRMLRRPLRPLIGLQRLDRRLGELVVDGIVDVRSEDGDTLRDRAEIVAEGEGFPAAVDVEELARAQRLEVRDGRDRRRHELAREASVRVHGARS